MKLAGKIIGGISGGVLSGNILGLIIGGTLGHILYDFNEKTSDDEDIIDESMVVHHFNAFNSIVKLCFGLINLKPKYHPVEIDTIRTFFKKEFKFEKKDILKVGEIIKNCTSNDEVINFPLILESINQSCKYEEKLLVIQLLFIVAVCDAPICNNEEKYIFESAKKINIEPEDFIKIKECIIKKENVCYEILDILPTATNNEIKIAYRRLVNKYHPDKNLNQSYDKEKFQEIINAYNLLKMVRKIK